MESLIGKTLDSYHILEVVGRGGMGVVLKAMDTSLEKIVALKMIDPILARDGNFVRRFKTEAKALARLENPNIVAVYALREIDSRFFMVMEYVSAKPLSSHLQEYGAFNLFDTISISKQLLSAIRHAHSVGVIHRDIKPSNILLCDNGKIKVTDFGLAKVMQQKNPESTVTQTRAGTLYYMSPEQVKGLKNVDTRSDLYSLGMTIYEMITGRVPFDKTESDFTIQKKIVDGEIPSPLKFNSNIPKKLIKIILKSIDKDPKKRYQNAEEMIYDIEKFEKETFEAKDKEKLKYKIKNKSNSQTNLVFKPVDNLQSKKKDNILKSRVLFYSSVMVIIILAGLYFIFSPHQPYLSIETKPTEANILINNVVVGSSPIEYKLQKKGNIKIKATKKGYTTVDTSLNITLLQAEKLTLKLIPLPKGQISIKTEPSDANVIINNSLAGNSPLENYLITVGKHQLRIEKAGFKSLDTVINVNENLLKNFNFYLAKDPNYKGSGSLSVKTVPVGAAVYINEKWVGKTPYENRGLPAGKYHLAIRQNGYEDYTEHVKIILNKTKIISKQLIANKNLTENPSGRVRIITKPAGASVYLNGGFVGSTPYENNKLPTGSYKILIKKTGYTDVHEKMDIKSNKLNQISMELSQVYKLAVNSEPAGAEVLVDNKPVGTTPYNNSQIENGEHLITVSKPGFKSYSEKIQIAKNATAAKIYPKLEPVTSKVEILVRPYGTIYIDDQLKIQDTNSQFTTELRGGKHTVKIEHPTLGSLIKEIDIVDEKFQKYIFDLRRFLRLTVISNPSNGEIFINGVSSGKYTPSWFQLKQGNFKIQVKKAGFVPLEKNYDVSSDIFESLSNSEDKLEFTLSKVQ